MNKEYIKDYRKVIVKTDKGVETREKTDNIVDVLETENNIEEIKNLKNLVKKGKFSNLITNTNFIMKKRVLKTILNIVLPILLGVAILEIIGGTLLAMESLLWLSIAGSALIALKIGKHKMDAEIATENAIKKQSKLVDTELKNQHAKLKELVKNAKIDKYFTTSGIGKVKKINKTDLLKNLKRKLELINFYELNKDGFILTKINEGNFSDNEKEFLKNLIIQEEIEKENKKTKIFKK